MNDPHVGALIYVIEHDINVEYNGATPIEHDRPKFHVRLKDERVRFEFKEHYATVSEAQAVVQPFIDQWEFEEELRIGPGQFALRLEKPEITDRQPTQGVFVGIPSPIRFNFRVSKAAGIVSRPYPQPPSEAPMDVRDPDVDVMRYRYLLYRQERDLLASMAYFCLDVFTKRLSHDFADAANKHKISHNLIIKVHDLSSNKGGAQGRHAHGIVQTLTSDERRILDKAVVAMIIRAAKVAADPNQHMLEINLGNLLEISP